MHTEKSNVRRGLNTIVGLAVAGATLMAGLVALPASKAAAATGWNTEDDYHAAFDPNLKPKLTVTKYLSTTTGGAPTGSVDDATAASKDRTPAVDVVFNVFEVTPKSGTTFADIDPANDQTYVKVPNQSYAGITDGGGVISTWFTANTDGSLDTAAGAREFPAGVHYYVMVENQSVSPSFQPGGRYAGQGYEAAQNSFFSLPFRTQDNSNGREPGYLYHLHLYPKNVNNSDITKQVTNWVDGSNQKQVLARPGDTITYKLNQKIYNEHPTFTSPNTSNKDGKLDVAELQASGIDLRVSDRLTTALEYQLDSESIQLVGGSAPMTLGSGDYDRNLDEKVPGSFQDDRTIHADKPLFPNDPKAGTKYLTFDFFKNPSAIKSYISQNDTVKVFTLEITFKAKVTAAGDSTGASQGSLQNTVMSTNSDVGNGVNPGGRVDTPSATASFGKVTKDGNPLGGAVFRLVDPTDDNKYLASDGNTYSINDLPPGASFYSATSTTQGAVVFTALPILDSNNRGRYGNWRLEEWKAPAGYNRPTVLFSKISFAPATATDYDINGVDATDIVRHFGSTPLEATHKFLSFGQYNYKGGNPAGTPANEITVGGHKVGNYMANYTGGDGPVTLPLTGGRGIALLLVIGLLVMGGALYARNRRNASRA